MVHDPFSALALANSIVQFVDFSSKLLSESKEIYRSVNGTTAKNCDLEIIVQDLAAASLPLADRSPEDRSLDETLARLAKACNNVAGDLLSELTKLKAPESHRKWKSAYQALTSVWKHRKIRDYKDRLNDPSAQSTSYLVTTLRFIYLACNGYLCQS